MRRITATPHPTSTRSRQRRALRQRLRLRRTLSAEPHCADLGLFGIRNGVVNHGGVAAELRPESFRRTRSVCGPPGCRRGDLSHSLGSVVAGARTWSEGGHYHCRGRLPGYLERLRATGRSTWADVLELDE